MAITDKIYDLIDKVKGLKDKLPFIGGKAEGADDDLSLGDDLSLDEGSPPGADMEPDAGPAPGAPPATAPPSRPEPSFEPEPEPEPRRSESPREIEELVNVVKDLRERLETLSSKMETLHAELNTSQSESELERSILKRYDFHLSEMSEKLDLLEKQHERMWDTMQGQKTKKKEETGLGL